MRANTERRLRRAVARRAGCESGSGWTETACAYCGCVVIVEWDEGDEPRFWTHARSGYPTDPAHLDHVIPESKNGPTSLDNTVIACASCNLAKGDSAFGDPGFLTWLADRRQPISFDALWTFHQQAHREVDQ